MALLALHGDRQFEIASEKVRDLARRRLSGAMTVDDFNREMKWLSLDELGQLTALLLKAPLQAKEQPVEDSDGPHFVTA